MFSFTKQVIELQFTNTPFTEETISRKLPLFPRPASNLLLSRSVVLNIFWFTDHWNSRGSFWRPYAISPTLYSTNNLIAHRSDRVYVRRWLSSGLLRTSNPKCLCTFNKWRFYEVFYFKTRHNHSHRTPQLKIYARGQLKYFQLSD
jgi:hypothetical protein